MKHFRYLKGTSALLAPLLAAACSDGSTARGLGEVFSPASTPASVHAAAGATAQAAAAGTPVAVAPSVIVRDASGQGMPGVAVHFTVTAGGGSVANPVTVTNAQGEASAGKWTLGVAAGTNLLQAAVSKLAPLQFSATATSTNTTPTPPVSVSPYNIAIRYIGSATARQQLAVTNAIARWQSVITRDLADIPLNAAAKSCWDTQPAVNERIDDLLLFVEFVEIDGAGRVLGEAGPCYVRSDNKLPILGHLKLDAADLRQMESRGTLDDVVLHEIGHILGIGTLWTDRNLLQGKGSDDPTFVGANAISEYRIMGGTLATIPVENTGGDGTRDGHWRESIFGNELMTGWVGGSSNPLSAMTIASLVDMGYGANASLASGFTLSSYMGTFRAPIQLGEEKMKGPKFKVDRKGRKTPL